MAINIILGIFAIFAGLFSLSAYVTKNEKFFLKRQRMIIFWGKKLGTFIHFISYVIIPIIVGVSLIAK